MTTDLDTRIRRAMTELAEAAPPPPSLPQLSSMAVSQAAPRRLRLFVAATVVAAGLIVAVVVAVRNDGAGQIVNTPRLDVPVTGSTAIGTTSATLERAANTTSAAPISSTASEPTSSTVISARPGDTLGLSGVLLGGLAIWGIDHVAAPPTGTTTSQLFGVLTADGSRVDRGILIRTSSGGASTPIPTTPQPPTGASAPDPVKIRGQSETILSQAPGLDFFVTWIEDNHTVTAMARGIDQVSAIEMLNNMRWNGDSALGFDPQSSPLPLLTSATVSPSDMTPVTWYRLSANDQAFTADGPDNRLIVGNTTYLAPDVVFSGVKQSNGYVVCDTCRPYGIVALAPTGQVVVGPQHLGGGSPNDQNRLTDMALLDAIAPVSEPEIVALDRAATDRLGTLPVISSLAVGPAMVEVRGRDPLTITALCLAVEAERTCNLLNQRHDSYKPLPGTASAILNGRWYLLFTTDSADDTALTVTTSNGVTLTPTVVADATRRWQLYLVPDGASAVSLSGPHLFPSPSFARPPDNSASTNAPAIAAPANGGPTAGATTTTLDPHLLSSYTVRRGDSLYSIAQSNGTTIDAIVHVNGWREGPNHILLPGDQIHLPS